MSKLIGGIVMKFRIQLLLTTLLTSVLLGILPTQKVAAQDHFSFVMISEDPNIVGANFILSAWEGLISFARDNNIEEGEEGYNLLTVYEEQDWERHFQTAIEGDYDLIVVLGSQAGQYVDNYAPDYPDQNFLLVDGKLDYSNVLSVAFKDYEAAYLAGIAAAMETESNSIGFIGGMDNEVIRRFEKGFVVGVEETNPDIEVISHYLEDFNDLEGAKDAASSLFSDGVDVIFHAAGQAGMGIFEAGQLAIEEGKQVWVIGADEDQTQVGEFTHQDQDYSITLTSTLKKVGQAIQELSQEAYDGNFQSGFYEYGMFEGAVDIAAGNLTGDTYDSIADYRSQLQSGDLDLTWIVTE